MITIRDWVASIPPEDKTIAYVGENESVSRQFLLTGEGWETYRDWGFHLDMAFDLTTVTHKESWVRETTQQTQNENFSESGSTESSSTSTGTRKTAGSGSSESKVVGTVTDSSTENTESESASTANVTVTDNETVAMEETLTMEVNGDEKNSRDTTTTGSGSEKTTESGSASGTKTVTGTQTTNETTNGTTDKEETQTDNATESGSTETASSSTGSATTTTTKETRTVTEVDINWAHKTDIAFLEKEVTAEGLLLTWVVLKQQTQLPGRLRATLRGVSATGQIKKTGIMVFQVEPAVEATPAAYVPQSEFEVLEQHMDAIYNSTLVLAQQAEQQAAYANSQAQYAQQYASQVGESASVANAQAAYAGQAAAQAAESARVAQKAADEAAAEVADQCDAAASRAALSAKQAATEAGKATAAARESAASAGEAAEAASSANVLAGDAAESALQAAEQAVRAESAVEQAATQAQMAADSAAAAQAAANWQAATANAIRREAQGRLIRVDDLSPLAHTYSVCVVGENRLPAAFPDATKTENGITYTDLGGGRVKLDGTAAGVSTYTLASQLLFPAGTYRLSGGKSINCRVFFKSQPDGETGEIQHNYVVMAAEKEMVLAEDTYLDVYVSVAAGTYSGEVLTPRAVLSDLSTVTVLKYGKNLLPTAFQGKVTSDDGVSFTDNGDGSITVTGTATKNSQFRLNPSPLYLPPGQYVVSGGINGTYTTAEGKNKYFTKSSPVFTLEEGDYVRLVYITLLAGETLDATLYPMLEAGTTTTAYEPPSQPETYQPAADGTVAISLQPEDTVTLLTQREDTSIRCVYNRDATKVINRLLERVAALEA